MRKPYFENPFTIAKGSICVLRNHSVEEFIKPCAFLINPKENWREWSGAFSILY